jgi:sterol 3beta-glucosyltransferase
MKKARVDGKKLVYIGFGSIVVENVNAMLETVIQAVTTADVRCVLGTGWSDRETKVVSPSGDAPPPLDHPVVIPKSIFPVKSVPHDWLFPQMDAVVHHAGSGTTGASLRAGVPTIAKPFFGDQYFFSQRIEDLGVGIYLKRMTAETFWRALRDATTDQRMIDAARRLGEKIRKEDGVANAINAIWRDLEYARSLIKRGAGEGGDGAGEGGPPEDIEEHWTFVEPDSGNELGRAGR